MVSQQIYENLGIIIGATIATIIPYLTAYIKKFKTKSFFKNSIKNREKINIILSELRTFLDADRVSLIEYHNGDKSLSGVPFKYASMTYENTNNRTKELIFSFQKVPISPILPMLRGLLESKHGYVKVDTTKKSSGSNELVNRTHNYYGVTTAFNFKIGSSLEEGVLSIIWTDSSVELDAEEIEFVRIKLLEIRDILNKLK